MQAHRDKLLSMDSGVHVIIQARMGSTRLPGKTLEICAGGLTVLEWVVERARTSRKASRVIVATTADPKDDVIENLCRRRGYDYVRGSELDVLARYLQAARQFDSHIIVRVTADNPLIDAHEMDRIVDVLENEGLDYASNHPAGLPLGTGSEVFTREALERAAEAAHDPYEHEHVTPYFYRHPELFRQREVAPEAIHPFAPSVRLTIDTPEDLQFFRTLATELALKDPSEQPATNEILSYLAEHPELPAINQDVVQKTFPTRPI